MDKMPPLLFATSVAHVAGLGSNVVISFSGFEHGTSQDRSLPIAHRIVMSRDDLVQGIAFLQGWLDGTLTPVDPMKAQ